MALSHIVRGTTDQAPGQASVLVLDKAIDLLAVIAADAGATPLTALAARAGLPPATAHRIAATLQRRGMLARVGRGRFLPGLSLMNLAGPAALNRLIAGLGAPTIARLARQTRLAAHLGVFEGEMVTYLIKEGRESARIFTREGQQLEAYCSGIGKALLAHLPDAERERYLASGEFVGVTPNTITAPDALRADLRLTRARGYAVDDCEIDFNLRCVAMPIMTPDGTVIAAISISSRDTPLDQVTDALPALRDAKHEIETKLAAG